MASALVQVPEVRLVDRFDLADPAGVPISGNLEIAAHSSSERDPRLLVVARDFKREDRLASHLLDPATWSIEDSKEYLLNSSGRCSVAAVGDLNLDGVQDFLVSIVEPARDGDGTGTCLALSGADLAELFRVSGRERGIFISQAAPDLGQGPSFWMLYTALESGLGSHGMLRVSRNGEVSQGIAIPGLQHEPTLAAAIRGPGGTSTVVVAEPTLVHAAGEGVGGFDDGWFGRVERVALSLVGCSEGLAHVGGRAALESGAIGTNADWSYAEMIACGDLDGDGVHDVAVSTPEEGAVRLLSGSDLSLSRTIGTPDEWPYDCGGFGRSMLLLPDCDGDGIEDLVVGNPKWAGESPTGGRWEKGAFHVYSLASGRRIESFHGGDTIALGAGFAAFREEDGVRLIAVASRELLSFRIAAD